MRHVLVADGRATGVVDWGDTALADAAVDLRLPYAAFDHAARTAFLTAYGAVGDGTELRARALAVHVSAALLDYGLDLQMTSLVDEASAGLARAVS